MSGSTLVFGLVSGGIYGLIALGIVLVYRGSRVLNFAQGEIGTLGLYIAYIVQVEWGAPWIVGAAAALLVAAAVGMGFWGFVVRPINDGDRLSISVASIGLISVLISFEFLRFGASPRSLPAPLSGNGVTVAGVVVSPTQILSLILVLVIGLALGAFLKRTDFGLGVLAAAQDPAAVRLVGIPLWRVQAFTWTSGAILSTLAALLIEPSIGVFAPGFASELFLYGLAAALIGGLTSLPGAFVGGLVVGIVEATVRQHTLTSSVPGLTTVAVFAMIVAILLLRPQGLLGRKGATA